LKILYHLTLKRACGDDHAAHMEDFYAGQAETYDRFREHMLHGRRELYSSIEAPPGGIWVDLGGGTASNLEHIGQQLQALRRVYVVDLSQSMLNIARRRVERHAWKNVEMVKADAVRFQPPAGPADVVTLSYSLTMIPDWFAAIENAWSMLKPGGIIGVTDFYVSRKYPADGMARHCWLSRVFWPAWFDRGGLFLSSEHVPYLHRRFPRLSFTEAQASMPYLLLLRVPFYIFIGRKPASPQCRIAAEAATGWTEQTAGSGEP
jgi:S-adenosylmethionine-diacylgycerolhomoserine-N-methlytransferase